MDEKRFWIGLTVGLFAWFAWLYPMMKTWIASNAFMAFFIIMGIYLYVVMEYIFKISPLKNPTKFLAFFLIWMAFDIVVFPYLVSPAGLISTDPNIYTSSDVVVYNAIHQTGDIGYYMTFVLVPIALLYAARKLLSQKSFFGGIREVGV